MVAITMAVELEGGLRAGIRRCRSRASMLLAYLEAAGRRNARAVMLPVDSSVIPREGLRDDGVAIPGSRCECR